MIPTAKLDNQLEILKQKRLNQLLIDNIPGASQTTEHAMTSASSIILNFAHLSPLPTESVIFPLQEQFW